MGRQIVGVTLLLLALALLFLFSVRAQDDDLPNLSGQWVGIVEWDYIAGDPPFPPDVRTYRLNILQDGDELHAAHIVHGDDALVDLIYTQPLENFSRPIPNSFAGTLTGATLQFNDVSVQMTRCQINITLNYARVEGADVLAGEFTAVVYPPPSTRESTLTPAEAARAPDVIVGCHAPIGSVVLRRFAPLDMTD